jgi:L-alanine-DL-glutamate epimerase-like enolase superfamily enzyme
MPPLTLDVAIESWPLAAPFVISRGAKAEARVVIATLADGRFQGRGECVPYARYGETVEGVAAALHACGPCADRAELGRRLPAGAARNALDCALWDLEAKRSGLSAASLAGVPPPAPVVTCYTLSLAAPADMAVAALRVPHLPLLKLKLGGAGDAERMAAVRAARPDARLVCDANEAWAPGLLEPLLAAAAAAGVELVEQPLPAGADDALASTPHPVPICADESAHSSADLPALADRYDAVNIKLDKAGGLTEALAMTRAARANGLRVMIGSMVATSLAAAPALLLAGFADWVDLDGPLLLARDRSPGLAISDGWLSPPPRALWG